MNLLEATQRMELIAENSDAWKFIKVYINNCNEIMDRFLFIMIKFGRLYESYSDLIELVNRINIELKR